MTYRIIVTNKFQRAVKKCKKRGLKMELLKEAIGKLERDGKLPSRYKPHKLTGNYRGLWECHLQPDWLLVWKQDDDQLILMLIDTGSHSDLF